MKYIIVEEGTTKAVLTELLEKFADLLDITGKPERYEFIGEILLYSVPFKYSFVEPKEVVSVDLAIFDDNSCDTIDIEEYVYLGTDERILGDRVFL
jgi:hypothetical protein